MSHGITVHFESEEQYLQLFANPQAFRVHLIGFFKRNPELKPDWFDEGFTFHKIYHSKKLPFSVRQIRPRRESASIVTVQPSFLLPYFVMHTTLAQAILDLSLSGASYEAIIRSLSALGEERQTRITEEKISRIIRRLGRSNLVLSTVKQTENLSTALSVDEKHTKANAEKCYIAMAGTSAVLLGAALLPSCRSESLSHGYGLIAEEIAHLRDYEVSSVTSDGFASTQIAIREAFPDAISFRCFLHSWLPLRDKYSTNPCFNEASRRIWSIYFAKSARELGQRIRRLKEYALKTEVAGLEKLLLKVCNRKNQFAYKLNAPGAKRTTNEIDRLMRPLTRYLEKRGNLRGNGYENIYLIRGVALLINFRDYTERTKRKDQNKVNPFFCLNEKLYSKNWLENLYIARVA